MNRREFLFRSIAAGAGFTFLHSMFSHKTKLSGKGSGSSVVQITDPFMRDGNDLDEKKLGKILDEGLSSLYNSASPGEVMRNLFSPEDVIGLKVNTLSGPRGSTHRELVGVIIDKLLAVGLPPGNIIIWDRSNDDLEGAGYRINMDNRKKVRCFGNDYAGYDKRLYLNGSIGSLLSRTVTDVCSAIINIPVLKDHGIVGVSLSMKNYFGAIHNPNKYHDNHGDPYIADLFELPIIRRKTRLIICDALDAQYEGGPPFKPQWNWPMNSLLMAFDGVALDRVGWEIIEKKRMENGFGSLESAGRKPQYILTAGQKNLGQSDLANIRWQKVEA